MQALWARLGRPGPVSAKRLEKEFGWMPETCEAVLAAAAREKLLEIASTRALSKEALAKEAARNFRKCCSTKKIEKLIAGLVREGLLRPAVAVVGRGTLYYRSGVALPLVNAFRERLAKLGLAPGEIDRALAPQTGGSFAAEELLTRLLDKVRELEEAPGVPVTVHRLRAAFPRVPKADFDRAVIELADRRQIYLVPHDHGWALPEPEREKLVHDGGVKLYVGVQLRR